MYDGSIALRDNADTTADAVEHSATATQHKLKHLTFSDRQSTVSDIVKLPSSEAFLLKGLLLTSATAAPVASCWLAAV